MDVKTFEALVGREVERLWPGAEIEIDITSVGGHQVAVVEVTDVRTELAVHLAGRLERVAGELEMSERFIGDAPERAAAREVLDELGRAKRLHAPMHSAHEGFAVIEEERDELWDEVKARRPEWPRVRHEATQLGAMALRFLVDVCNKHESPGSRKTSGVTAARAAVTGPDLSVASVRGCQPDASTRNGDADAGQLPVAPGDSPSYDYDSVSSQERLKLFVRDLDIRCVGDARQVGSQVKVPLDLFLALEKEIQHWYSYDFIGQLGRLDTLLGLLTANHPGWASYELAATIRNVLGGGLILDPVERLVRVLREGSTTIPVEGPAEGSTIEEAIELGVQKPPASGRRIRLQQLLGEMDALMPVHRETAPVVVPLGLFESVRKELAEWIETDFLGQTANLHLFLGELAARYSAGYNVGNIVRAVLRGADRRSMVDRFVKAVQPDERWERRVKDVEHRARVAVAVLDGRVSPGLLTAVLGDVFLDLLTPAPSAG